VARISGVSGKVFVKVLISEDGHPLKAIVMKRIPAECLFFDSVALKSVVDSKYYPGIKNGRPVKVWCVVPISFQLN
jgi:protein TonB